ncbi:MAG: hypothetical protein QF619_04455, partial [Candidatus Binatia bacterium]|nr:hypothetical protein [Candidatus Binatia bacterium]
MLKMVGSLILLAALSLGLQACAVQQLKVNPGFGKKGPSALPSAKNGSYAERPVWKVGYWWKYSWRRLGASDSVTERVIREDEFEGHPSYVVQRGKYEYYYTKDVLGVIAKMSEG